MSPLLLFCGLAMQTAPPRADTNALLLNVRKKLSAAIHRPPNYVCTETINRTTLRPQMSLMPRSCEALRSLQSTPGWKLRDYIADRLRIDATVAGDSLAHSWVGGASLDKRTLAELAESGTILSGYFAPLIASIFESNAATITLIGNINDHGRNLVQFGFHVPIEKSRFKIGSPQSHIVAGYSGTFDLDPSSSDLVDLTVRADQLPFQLKLCDDITTLTFSPGQLENAAFMIPSNVQLRLVMSNGWEMHNRTEFSDCHEFAGSLPQSSSASIDKPADKSIDIPPGLPFRLALTTPIVTEKAAAGDTFEARLISPIRERHRKIVVPKGAIVKGRLLQVRRVYEDPGETLTIALSIETVNDNGTERAFHAGFPPDSEGFDIRQQLEKSETGPGGPHHTIKFIDVASPTADFIIKPGYEIDGVTY